MKPSYIKNSLLKTISYMQDDPSDFVNNPGVDFSRTRKCSLSDVILFTINMETGSLNREIRRFFPEGKDTLPTKSAVIQQRIKLSEKAFRFLFSSMNERIPFRKKFKGYHLLACDGSDVDIPPLPQDSSTYVPSNTTGVGYHQVHLNALYDVLEERYVDIIAQPRAEFNEREAFLSFLCSNPIPGKCIYIADRGYFSMNVLVHLLNSGQSFLIRARAGEKASFMKRFPLPETDEFDVPVSFSITRSAKKIYKEHPDQYVCIRKDRAFDHIDINDKDTLCPVSVRVAKIDLPDGPMYLFTNLPKDKFDLEALKKLYSLRWGIETSFRTLKYNIALTSFHSIRRDLILQEIYARVILYNITMAIVHTVSVRETGRKLQYKISVSDAVVTCRYFLLHKIKNTEIEEMIRRYLTDVRPERSFPRKKRSKRYVPLTNRA